MCWEHAYFLERSFDAEHPALFSLVSHLPQWSASSLSIYLSKLRCASFKSFPSSGSALSWKQLSTAAPLCTHSPPFISRTSGCALGWCKTPGRCDPLVYVKRSALVKKNGMFDVNHFPPLPRTRTHRTWDEISTFSVPRFRVIGKHASSEVKVRREPHVWPRDFLWGGICNCSFWRSSTYISGLWAAISPFTSTSGHNSCNSSQSAQTKSF